MMRTFTTWRIFFTTLLVMVMASSSTSSPVHVRDATCFKKIKVEDCKSRDEVKKAGCIHDAVIDGHILELNKACYVCPKSEREICGGYQYSEGRCLGDLQCSHEILKTKYTMNIIMCDKTAPTGKCIRKHGPGTAKKACFNNCCKKSKMPQCGNDGNWYYHRCFLSTANCFRPVNATHKIEHYKGNVTEKCGPEPSDIELPEACTDIWTNSAKERPLLHYVRPTSTSSNSMSIIPTLSSEVAMSETSKLPPLQSNIFSSST